MSISKVESLYTCSKIFNSKKEYYPYSKWKKHSGYLSQMKKLPEISELNNRSKGQKIYTCGYTIIEYILHEYGREKLITLIGSYGDIKNVLNVSKEQFSKDWYMFLQEMYLK